MNDIVPWCKEAENILKRLNYSGRASTLNKKLPRDFGMKCKHIINQDLLDIATIRNKRERRTWFILPEDVMVTPKGRCFQFKRFKIL